MLKYNSTSNLSRHTEMYVEVTSTVNWSVNHQWRIWRDSDYTVM